MEKYFVKVLPISLPLPTHSFSLLGQFFKPVAVSGKLGIHLNRRLSSFSLFTVLFLFIGHIILFLHLSSYARTILTKHKPIPPEVSY